MDDETMSTRSGDNSYDSAMVTLAKQVFTNRYRKRPKSSLRMSMAKFKLPSAIALVHFSAYGKCPDAARTSPIPFRVTTNVKSFLANQDRKKD